MMSNDWAELVKWVWRGKTVRRAFMNLSIKRNPVGRGLVLDLGGKGRPSYREVSGDGEETRWLAMDISSGEGVSIVGNITAMPFKEGTFETVMCFNVLEHVYDYRAALSEIRRILKTDGRMFGFVPFLCNVHPDPHDYWRFTDECLHSCLTDAGLLTETVAAQAGVFTSCFDLGSFVVRRIPFIRVLLYLVAVCGDRVLWALRPGLVKQFASGYFFIGRKI